MPIVRSGERFDDGFGVFGEFAQPPLFLGQPAQPFRFVVSQGVDETEMGRSRGKSSSGHPALYHEF
jgi:hypothetical protein